MKQKKQKIYVTGGSGMVGRNFIEGLDQSLYDVIAPQYPTLDLRNFDDVFSFIQQERPDIILHTAGQVGGIQSQISDPYGYFTNNMLMGINIVRAAKENGVRRLINLASASCYPGDGDRPMREDMILAGYGESSNNGYATAKAAILKMCYYINLQFSGYCYKTLVPCNLYGRYDKFDEHNAQMIPSIIRRMHQAKAMQQEDMVIWGDGSTRKECMFVTDFVQILMKILELIETIPPVMNVGLGYDSTVDEYYEIASRVIGYRGKFKHDLTRPSGGRRKLLDVSEQKKLGLMPQFTLEEGIRATYEYFLHELNEI